MSVRRTLATVIAASALAVASVLAAAPAQAAGPRHYVETQDFTIAEHPLLQRGLRVPGRAARMGIRLGRRVDR